MHALSDIVSRLLAHMQPIVFLGSAALVLCFVSFGTGWPEAAQNVFGTLQRGIIANFGWLYILGASGLLVFVLGLLISPYRHIRLGGDQAEPEFGYLAWFAMLFSAGMGTGLVFWGVAEPLTHWSQPPFAPDPAEGALREAMRLTYFHWGLHPWAIYIVFGLSLAYFHFRHDLPLAPRSLLYPMIGERIHGPIGHGVDILATVGTLFGVATSLGLGAMQINAGLEQTAGIGQSTATQVGLIALITAIATVSVVSGVRHGIRWLSTVNLALAGLLMGFVLVFGPTVFQIKLLISSTGAYLQELIDASLWLELRPDTDPNNRWQADWTLFYWSWWISWSPFVGVFVARISRGRTIGEFILSVLLAPVAVTFLWFAVFGGTALYQQVQGGAELAGVVVEDAAAGLHALLGTLPLSAITSLLATLMVVVFFVTSSDSGSLVDDMVTSGGDPHPPRAQRVFWAVAEGLVAATLLLSGGLQALRTASLTSGLPMTVLLLITAWGLLRALQADETARGIPSKSALRGH
ncbi:Glycine betaine transporter OpuD [Thiorhodovibrio winogradskyi]|uniref:Glycine betaine transporter OpuD n=1 Tax=Thiorhodovibrio winogradskyi TaxID=77007 RepID=A0ABZ0S8G8_9GAMM|nr:BCCT family transporter [Thiorhodovibrio winogradskyi]